MCRVFVSRLVLASKKSEFGLCGVVGGMLAIEMLACAMRLGAAGLLRWR